MSRLPASITQRLRVPLIAAPMLLVSGPDLVIAASRAGAIGSFPTKNCRTVDELERWLARIREETEGSAPFAPNLIVHKTNTRLEEDTRLVEKYRCAMVITSVGSPAPVMDRLHAAGTLVFADVASMRHVERALEVGVDGLILLTAGAGGQTGWANPFAFVRAVRERFAGPVVLAGGISDGYSIRAAQVLGADFAYLGTKFIATAQSAAGEDYKQALVAATLDDVRLSDRVGGLPASLLASWLDTQPTAEEGEAGYVQDRLMANRHAWSAGHSVSGVRGVSDVEDVIEQLLAEYQEACGRLP